MGHVETMTEETKRLINDKLEALKPGEVAMFAGTLEKGRPTVCLFQKDISGRFHTISLDIQGIMNTHKLLAEVIATAENDVSRN